MNGSPDIVMVPDENFRAKSFNGAGPEFTTRDLGLKGQTWELSMDTGGDVHDALFRMQCARTGRRFTVEIERGAIFGVSESW